MRNPATITAQRSFHGCRMCRLRRVKCDEVRNLKGQCGSCARLNRQCDWTRQWKFVDATEITESLYVHCPESRVSSYTNRKTLQEPPLVFVNMFSDQPSHLAGNSTRTSARAVAVNLAGTHPPRSSFLEPEPHPEPELAPRRRIDSVHQDVMSYGISSGDNLKHLLLFDTLVCKKLIPMAVRYKLNIQDNQNVLVILARGFPPLHHAICAITLLHNGLNCRPELVAGSFQHYDRAVSSYHEHLHAHSDTVFFLHFILLVFDIACASQRWPGDRDCWALHLPVLAGLVSKPSLPINRRLKAYLSWYVLLLDSQAGLAGNQESGHYVRAVLDIDCRLPIWPLAPSLGKTYASSKSVQTFTQAHELSLLTLQMTAEQSQLALQLRRLSREKCIGAQERRHQIQRLSDRHAHTWGLKRPDSMVGDERRSVSSRDRQIITSTNNFARLQYSVLSLHLHTSMYPGQRMDGGLSAQKDAENCTYIIETIRERSLYNERENCHFVYPLFLAGIATKEVRERKEVLDLLDGMQYAGWPGAVNRVKHLLGCVIKRQAVKDADGGGADEVDWIELSQKLGFKNIILGM